MSAVTEAELKASAVAPRVTLEGLEASIKERYFYNMRTNPELQTLTLCVLVLQNGYTVVGKSACANVANFNEDIGNRLAEEDAKRDIWPLMGYALKEEIFKNGDGSFTGRMQREANELLDKINKLVAFIGGETFKNIPGIEQDDLLTQRNAMLEYHEVLLQRIKRNS